MKLSGLWYPLAVVALVVLFDQATKVVAGRYFTVYPNQGISFGLGAVLPAELVTATVSVVLAIVVMHWLRSGLLRRHPVSLGMFVGGAVSNQVDRILLGYVVDWLPVPFTSLTNNLADWALFGGVILYLYGIRHSVSGSRSTADL